MTPSVRCVVLLVGLALLVSSYFLCAPLNGKDLRTAGEACQVVVSIELAIVGLACGLAAFLIDD